MRFLVKLVLACVVVAVLIPFVGPETSLGKVVRAALDDAAGFCVRQPHACAQGASIAQDAGDLIAATIAQIRSEGGLTDADRALAPDPTIGDASSETFAGHGSAIDTSPGTSRLP